jgi:hypothetical protein
MNQSHTGTTPLWMCALLLFIVGYSSMFNNISLPNERSRAYLATSIVDEHTFSIDTPLKRFGRIGDRARYEGHYFSDKAPGSAILGSLSYGIARLFTEAKDWTMAELLRLFRRTLSLPIALLGFIWLRRLLGLYQQRFIVVEWTSWSWLLGSAAFHYSGAFFGHQMAAALLVGSFLYVRLGVIRSTTKSLYISGALSGCAVLIEYPAALGVLAIGLYAALHISTLKSRLVLWILAGLPFALLLGWYHQQCFGSSFSFPYEHLAAATYRKIHGAGLAGVTAPELKEFYFWFLGMRRGLLSSAPFFALSVIGLWQLRRIDWRAAVSLGCLITMVCLFASSAHIWGGDWGFGPRILVFSLGLISIPVAFGFTFIFRYTFLRCTALILMVYSIATHQLVHFIFPEPWAKFSNPVADLTTSMASGWLVAPNIGTLHLGLEGLASGIPLMGSLLGLLLYLMWCSCERNRRIFIPAVIIGALMLIGASMNYSDTKPGVLKKWVELVELWSSREAKYH